MGYGYTAPIHSEIDDIPIPTLKNDYHLQRAAPRVGFVRGRESMSTHTGRCCLLTHILISRSLHLGPDLVERLGVWPLNEKKRRKGWRMSNFGGRTVTFKEGITDIHLVIVVKVFCLSLAELKRIHIPKGSMGLVRIFTHELTIEMKHSVMDRFKKTLDPQNRPGCLPVTTRIMNHF